MAFTAHRIKQTARTISGVSLCVGLYNALVAFGVLGNNVNPVEHYGQFGFSVLVITAILRLFAAVGLWAYATWGAFLLIAASAIELGLIFLKPGPVVISPLGFGLSLFLLLGGIGLLIWRYINVKFMANEMS